MVRTWGVGVGIAKAPRKNAICFFFVPTFPAGASRFIYQLKLILHCKVQVFRPRPSYYGYASEVSVLWVLFECDQIVAKDPKPFRRLNPLEPIRYCFNYFAFHFIY